DHPDNPTNERIHISIGLNGQSARFRSYMDHNRLHWCYDLPCGVFHQELEKCLNLIQPLVGKITSVDVSESSHGYLPQKISDELLVTIEGSRSNATIEIKINEQKPFREIQLSSDAGTKRIRHDEVEGNNSVSEAGEHNLLGRVPKLIRNLRHLVKLPFKRSGLPATTGELAFISDIDSVTTATETVLEQYDFIHGALTKIAGQLSNIRLHYDNRVNTGSGAQDSKRVLITGASGLFGKRLSKYLNDKGFIVRAFIRKLSDDSYFKALGIEYCYGDVADTESLKQALEEVNYVVHAAADTSGNLDSGEASTVQGTRNVLDLCNQLEIESLVHISSCSVYDVYHLSKNAEIDESSILEQFPERRGGYTMTKLKADLLVQDAMSSNRGNITCLRPGTFISENGPFMTPIVGARLFNNVFVVFGLGNLILPLVFVENLCSATEVALTSTSAKGNTFNVIDGLSMSKREYLEKVVRKVYSNARFIFFPYKVLYFLIFLQEILLDFLRRKPYLTRYRFESSQKEIRYKSNKIEELLDWSPPISADEAIERILDEQKKGSCAGVFRR
ncbi:MAG: NAD(P)-dependent oxidoreductase, partial [Gammaproteobacteria bacterium]|nr:NAD(P)-dependent oxidoreductase [Gammaproteobacteria bacterium]